MITIPRTGETLHVDRFPLGMRVTVSNGDAAASAYIDFEQLNMAQSRLDVLRQYRVALFESMRAFGGDLTIKSTNPRWRE